MADYALFLKCSFNANGNFRLNSRQKRHPDARFWSEVATSQAGVISAVGNTNNADTTSMQMTARANDPTDRVYFAVLFVPPGPTPPPSKISIMCAINPVVVGNPASVASPFRLNGQVQLFFSSTNFKNIIVDGDTFQAIGPYELNTDPDRQKVQ